MTIKASGRAALILTTGIWIGLGATSLAVAATDSSMVPAATKHHHLKKYAHHRPGKVADKPAANKKTADAAADDSDASAAVTSTQMPASVANANAQMVSTATPAANAAPAAPADAQTTAQAPVVAPDQLNDVDRALQQPAPAAAPVAMASAEPQAETPPPPVVRASSESSAWDQSSLIGKIFIGFGALLTMASAARMFMA